MRKYYVSEPVISWYLQQREFNVYSNSDKLVQYDSATVKKQKPQLHHTVTMSFIFNEIDVSRDMFEHI